MLILIPIGQERAVRRLPLVTFSLMAIMILLSIYVELTAKSFSHRLQASVEEYQSVLSECRQDYIERFKPETGIPTDPEYIRQIDDLMRDIDKKVEKSIEAGELYELNSPKYTTWNSAHDRMLSAQRAFLPLSLGFKSNNPVWYTWFTSMFMHAGLLHLIGNLIFFYFAGIHIEDQWGRPVYLLIFLLGGLVSTLTHYLVHPLSSEPLVGASGAISAMMGALLIRFPKLPTRIFWFAFFLIIIRYGTFTIPAYVGISLWVLSQILYLMTNSSGPVAYWSHLGGFAFGASAGLFFIMTSLDRKLNARQEALAENDVFESEFEADTEFEKALDYEARGLTKAAIHTFNRCIHKHPDNLEIHYHLAWLYLKAGQATSAWNHLSHVMTHDLNARSYSDVIETLKRLKTMQSIQIIPEPELDAILDELKQNEFPNVAKDFKALWKQNQTVESDPQEN